MRGFQWAAFLNASIYAVLGVVIYAVSFVVLDKLTPFDWRREIIEEKNMALALLLGLATLGISIIVAAAVH
jgi:uncharacterized membrane protein YjfL (UPF0719 family)